MNSKTLTTILLSLTLVLASLPLAAERLAQVSTKFRMLGPNDKIIIEAFDDPDRDLAQFIESSVFHRCDQFLVPWPRGVEPYA